jgi:hypothetical protein
LKQILDNKIDLGIAWYHSVFTILHHFQQPHIFFFFRNFERVVLAGYRWLSDNYVDGDKIFLFGKELLLTSPQASLTVIQGFPVGLTKLAYWLG